MKNLSLLFILLLTATSVFAIDQKQELESKSIILGDATALLLEELYCGVTVKVFDQQEVKLEIAGELNQAITSEVKDEQIVIKGVQDESSANTVVINSDGNRVRVRQSGKDSSSITVINGKVTTDENVNVIEKDCLPITVYLPKSLPLKINKIPELTVADKLDNITIVAFSSGKTILNDVVTLKGTISGTADLDVKNGLYINLKLSGASSTAVKSASGDLHVSTKDSSSFDLQSGILNSAYYSSSGASRINSSATIAGPLTVDASGASRIIQSGKVAGEIQKNRKEAASIVIKK